MHGLMFEPAPTGHAAVRSDGGGDATCGAGRRFLSDDEAAAATEYSVMLTLIIVLALMAIGALGLKHKAVWEIVGGALGAATG